ncbi:gliding motility-associated C-terminal domain-containing protein [Roseivirga pacifica]|uniref:gliding motility-associated C-terminal domain-containing protein n=1 Tax=Roseivirga pacifica TaxID=1267423 RepID=UPI0020948935|nr:gliding motility-associated C-terminal domain-containing protein [Roseivirga pacifica]MCO6359580.1 T9SS type B sorting domain-containing protein [Roseivirga pacifica]MCO6366950.1 T9SS type B sorting domain-containing protein [Roseivirga pacifica]MCO6370518.1 T9SS type B sorting domain-containing protein [Roseivirga pacifica]MCO6374607.1 T9SS type B sorting domain-containing protein [Roseivirga pacifica]MCO6379865.1 T9SS type B sorting domain-containing protein [Roseivirga pacifica]
MTSTRLIFVLLILALASVASAQQYQKVDSIDVDGIRNPEMMWIDLNADRLYDLVVYGQDSAKTGTIFKVINNSRAEGFVASEQLITGLFISQLKRTDIDRNGIAELAFTGTFELTPLTSFLTVDSLLNFNISTELILNYTVSDFFFEDLDNDTQLDLLTLKDSTVTVFSGNDSLPFFQNKKVGQLYVSDLQSDGLKDIIYTTPNADTLVHFATNLGSFEWASTLHINTNDLKQLSGITQGKWTESAFPDLFLFGENEYGSPWNGLVTIGDTVTTEQVLDSIFVSDALVADFNSNGSSDLWLFNGNNKGYFMDSIPTFSDVVLYDTADVVHTAFADWNLNGHLDFAQLLRKDSLHFDLVFFDNDIETQNEAPGGPSNRSGVQARDNLIIAWKNGTDDLARDSTITYELIFLKAEDSTQVGNTNISAASRNLFFPTNGFQEYTRHKMFYAIEPGDYLFAVGTVDNAFNSDTGDGNYSLCTVCETKDLVVVNETLCRGSEKYFGEIGVERYWYSTTKGALGQHEMLNYVAEGNDTLYGSVIGFENCHFGQLEINIRVISGDSPNLPNELFVCSGEDLNLTVSDSFINPEWSTWDNGVISNEHSVTYLPTEEHILFFEAETTQGCTVTSQVRVVPVMFEAGVADTLYNIQYGQTVQLEAYGGVFYEWTPAISLDDPTIATPVAQPTENTTYVVTISNRGTCSEQFSVMVEVEQVGNVANLFSPNGDGTNDNLLVFLTQKPVSFQFQIFNRSGVLVYETTNPTEAMQTGWDGTNNNQPAPNGTYYWYVKGEYTNGQSVDLNGSKKGTLSLIR